MESIILEIRAGAGGNEAGLFAADLFRMYKKYAAAQGWQFKELSRSEGGLGNLKEISAKISGDNVYSKLRGESGVHRVQRIPKTEKSGRIHTSTATVAVLPTTQPLNHLAIQPSELKIETFRASAPGGQHAQKVETAVRLTHLPTGLTVSCQDERSQLQNKRRALSILQHKLYETESKKKKGEVDKLRQEQVGRAKRPEKIRTYNFPQNRVTDHRLRKSWHNLEEILNGNLRPIITEFER